MQTAIQEAMTNKYPHSDIHSRQVYYPYRLPRYQPRIK